jgi:hypothetical protein
LSDKLSKGCFSFKFWLLPVHSAFLCFKKRFKLRGAETESNLEALPRLWKGSFIENDKG